MNLTEAIREHALPQVEAGDWDAVAKILHSISEQSEPRECRTVETADALIAAGQDPTQLMQILAKDATGQFLLMKLAQSGTDASGEVTGVAWAHRLTIPYLQAGVAVGAISQKAIDALVQLSAPTIRPFESITADDCKSCWLVGADVLLAVNRTNGTLRISMNVTRNGEQVKLTSLTESQGSVADQALLTVVETAIDEWLQAGG